MQSQVRENSINADSSVVKLVAMFCPEGLVLKNKHFLFFI